MTGASAINDKIEYLLIILGNGFLFQKPLSKRRQSLFPRKNKNIYLKQESHNHSPYLDVWLLYIYNEIHVFPH